MRRAVGVTALLLALSAGPGLLPVHDARADGVDPAVWRWRDLAMAAGAKWDVPPGLILAEIAVESGGDPGAYNASGATGLMQIVPFAGRPGNLSDPAVNVFEGAYLLRQAEDAVGGWAPLPDPRGSWQAAINAYLYGHPFYGDTWYYERTMDNWRAIAAAGG